MRVLGIDYGDKRVGLALSDPSLQVAYAYQTIQKKHANEIKPLLHALQAIIEKESIGTFVLGFPKNMNNSLGPRAEITLLFKEKLEKHFLLPVILWDERLSTQAAVKTFQELKTKIKKRKETVDQTAAVFILQGYLDSQRKKEERKHI